MNSKFKNNWFLGLMCLLSACEIEDLEVPNSSDYSKVYISAAVENPVGFTVAVKDEWFPIPLGVGYGGLTLPQNDLQVKLLVEPQLAAEYNENNGTNYPLMPEDSYELENDVLTILKGENSSGNAIIKFNPLRFTGLRPHILPVSISEVDGQAQINEDLKTVYLLVTGRYEENPFTKFSQENWTIMDVSSDENDGPTTGGRAHHAIDGSLDTFWHSQWRRDENGNRPGHPHYIVIDMNETKPIHGLELFGRTNQIGGNGNPRDIYVEVSTDGEHWTGTLDYVLENTASNTIYFPEVLEARYFKITVKASHQDVYRTHIAEIEAF
ncbi:DUF1735 domain-containing protein [Echinicola marina]|uniref:discoidin domain-containing protein n=1 Tax=Echinicola marina TaxID=2859768 RepID=UPI001CF639C2|nr:DUF1735 domain-containing protein [Echinicola marina]UCS92122.1 DUF1735 domain-containing protein [Echinicola marina]